MAAHSPTPHLTGPDPTGLTHDRRGRLSRLTALVATMAVLAAAVVVPVTVALAPATPAGASNVFSDVTDTSPFHDEITWFAERGFTNGYPDGTFKPTAPVTRQAIAAYLHRLWLALANTDPDPLPDPGFTDVTPSNPFYNDIAWAAAMGLANGYPDNTYRPTEPITRDAIAALIHRLWALLGQYEADTTNAAFTDVAPGNVFRADIDWLATMSIGQGWPNGTYQPGQAVTRQGAAAFIMRLAATLGLFPHDYNRDGKADYGYIAGGWYVLGSTEPIFTPTGGGEGFLGGDYDGDGWWEPAAESDGVWETAGDRGTFTYAPPGLDNRFIPVPGNYDGSDPEWEAAYFDEITATWWIEGFPGPIQFGAGEEHYAPNDAYCDDVESCWWDVPTPGDFNGDGVTEIAVYHVNDGTTRTYSGPIPPSAGPSVTGPTTPTVAPPDIGGTIIGDAELGFPTIADFDGDLADEPAIYDQYRQGWFIEFDPPLSHTPPGDQTVPMAADYDGDFRADPTLLDWYTGTFHVLGGPSTPYPEAKNTRGLATPYWAWYGLIRMIFNANGCANDNDPVCPPGINPPQL